MPLYSAIVKCEFVGIDLKEINSTPWSERCQPVATAFVESLIVASTI